MFGIASRAITQCSSGMRARALRSTSHAASLVARASCRTCAPSLGRCTVRGFASIPDDDEDFPMPAPAATLSWKGADALDSMANVDEIFVNNKAWRDKLEADDPEVFQKLGSGQRPRYLWIGCSDSRVPAESLCGLPPGSLFVHRNIANVVANIDTSCMSVIQFAVTVLKVQHIVVCGHYGCGGVNAALTNKDHQSPLENWLRNIRDVIRLHQSEIDSIEDLDEKRRRMVEINVIEQSINLYKARVVQARRVETYNAIDEFKFVQPKIHPCVFDPATGILERLDVELQEELSKIRSIYNLYASEEDEVEWQGMGPSYMTP